MEAQAGMGVCERVELEGYTPQACGCDKDSLMKEACKHENMTIRRSAEMPVRGAACRQLRCTRLGLTKTTSKVVMGIEGALPAGSQNIESRASEITSLSAEEDAPRPVSFDTPIAKKSLASHLGVSLERRCGTSSTLSGVPAQYGGGLGMKLHLQEIRHRTHLNTYKEHGISGMQKRRGAAVCAALLD